MGTRDKGPAGCGQDLREPARTRPREGPAPQGARLPVQRHGNGLDAGTPVRGEPG